MSSNFLSALWLSRLQFNPLGAKQRMSSKNTNICPLGHWQAHTLVRRVFNFSLSMTWNWSVGNEKFVHEAREEETHKFWNNAQRQQKFIKLYEESPFCDVVLVKHIHISVQGARGYCNNLCLCVHVCPSVTTITFTLLIRFGSNVVDELTVSQGPAIEWLKGQIQV